jgi:hypothetical protein
MNINRKIQLAAAAVIANSALALGLMSPIPAFAAACAPKIVCAPAAICITGGQIGWCAHLYPGCTVLTAACSTPCGASQTYIECFFK